MRRIFCLRKGKEYENREITQLTYLLLHILCCWTYSSPCFYLKHNVSETRFCLRLQVEPTQLGPIDRASPYLRTPVPAPKWDIQAKNSTNHPRELRKYYITKTPHV
jgi:hypothetical protein